MLISTRQKPACANFARPSSNTQNRKFTNAMSVACEIDSLPNVSLGGACNREVEGLCLGSEPVSEFIVLLRTTANLPGEESHRTNYKNRSHSTANKRS